MKPDQLYQQLKPLFNQLQLPDIPMNEQGYYSFMLEGGEVFLELTEVDTLAILAFLPLPESPGEELLLELLQANLTPDQESSLIIAADKDDAKLVIWGRLRTDNLYLDTMLPLLEQLNMTLLVISRWIENATKKEKTPQEMADKNMRLSREAEALLNRRFK